MLDSFSFPWEHPYPVDIQGHRGARGLVSENSLPGFAHAARVGATAVELDVALTADGVLVVHHDPILAADKAAGPHLGRAIWDLDYDQLQAMDIGQPTQERFPEQRRVPGETIPTLAEVMELYNRHFPHMGLTVEIKTDPTAPTATASPEQFVEATLAVAEEAHFLGKILIESFDWRVVDRVHRLAPYVPTAALATVGETFYPGSPWLGPVLQRNCGSLIEAVLALGADCIAVGYSHPYGRTLADGATLMCGPDFVEAAHSVGLGVLPWTVNDEADLRACVAAGVDGIITDYPDRLRRILAEAR